MQLSPGPARMLRISVVVLPLVVAFPIATRFVQGEESFDRYGLGWIAAFVVFFGALVFSTGARPHRRALFAAMALQSAMVPLLVILVDRGYSFAASLLTVVTAQVVIASGRRAALVWSAIQSLPVIAVFFAMWRPSGAVVFTVIYVALQLFALLMTSVAAEEAALRNELSVINAELRATRQLVAESSRSEERLRIARELHDLAGHHLTALTLNLESAKHRLTDDARTDVEAALRTSRQLLTDIRSEVSAMRDLSGVRFDRALEALATSVSRPRIRLDIPEGLVVADGNSAMELLRCIQEITTNAARHGAASTLDVHILQDAQSMQIVARDDGRGARAIAEGNGLLGIRERIHALGGGVEYESPAEGGFVVRLHVPS